MAEQKQPHGDLAAHFQAFRSNTIGIDNAIHTPYGQLPKVYMDWTASGLPYRPIENHIISAVLPHTANTHTEQTSDGLLMTNTYLEAKRKIKKSVGGHSNEDILIVDGSGTTSPINKLQRILGLKVEDQAKHFSAVTGNKTSIEGIAQEDRPLVVISSLEHHSNDTSWLETVADVIKLPLSSAGSIDPEQLDDVLSENKARKMKIGSFTAASNVTGMRTPVQDLARVMHAHDGHIFLDYAAAAPYDAINMHPLDPDERLDAVFISPHKMLGGPQTPGVLIFNKDLYPHGITPDRPGGGTVKWTNPWGGRRYHDDTSVTEIEEREDGGTPPFIQTIRASMAFALKEKMGIENIHAREKLLTERLLNGLSEIPGIVVFQEDNRDRLGIVSHYYGDRKGNEFVPFDLATRLLNDKFGIEARGGCSCAGTLGHCLLHIQEPQSLAITDKIDAGDNSSKPGWVRLSVHPILTTDEIDFAVDASRQISERRNTWRGEYTHLPDSNMYRHRSANPEASQMDAQNLLIF